MIWDIQTGGVVKDIECTYNIWSLVWSLDGGKIDTTLQDRDTSMGCVVHAYDVVLGTTQAPGVLQSHDEPYLWAHNKSFQIMTTEWNSQAYTIDISEVGSGFSKVKSFNIGLWREYSQIKSFSPTTCRISVLDSNKLSIIDIQNSECLLEQVGDFGIHCFSSDGSLYAASMQSGIYVWKHASDSYTPWRQFMIENHSHTSLQFSPTLSSIIYGSNDILQV